MTKCKNVIIFKKKSLFLYWLPLQFYTDPYVNKVTHLILKHVSLLSRYWIAESKDDQYTHSLWNGVISFAGKLYVSHLFDFTQEVMNCCI